jgi:hypothetical protein
VKTPSPWQEFAYYAGCVLVVALIVVFWALVIWALWHIL